MSSVSYEMVTLLMRERDAAAGLPRRCNPSRRSPVRSAASVVARWVRRGRSA